MTVSLDVILGTLIFVLPGFIAVGAYVALGKFFSRPDLTRGTFVLLALMLSVPLLLYFNTFAPQVSGLWVTPLSVPESKDMYVAPSFLFSLTLLYLVAATLGALVAFGFNVWNADRREREGFCHSLNRLDVWTATLGSRTQTPYVIAVLEKSAYHGQLRRATTDADDPYIFVVNPDYVPLDQSQRPDWPKRTRLKAEGILLQKSDIKALWIVT